MLRDGIKNFGMFCACFLICFLVPITVKAGENVTGGASFEEATEIQWEKEYTTTNADGWFKVYAPENECEYYIGAGWDEFADVTVYSDDKTWLHNRVERPSTSVKLGTNTYYWNSYSQFGLKTGLEGGHYYYFHVTTEKAESCSFKVVYGLFNNSSANRKNLFLNQDYNNQYYVTDGYHQFYYQFTAANTGNYKVILKGITGSAKCNITYKNGSDLAEISADNNKVTEEIISVKQGVTYYVDIWVDEIENGATKAAQINLHISNAKVSEITLSASALSMKKGEQYGLIANVQPENAVDKTVTFSTSNANVATVSENGIVTAVRGGTAVISANANDGSGVQAFCQITVIPKLVTRLELNDDYVEEDLETFDDENYYYQLKATTYPNDADDGSVTYASSNSSIVSVNRQSGKLTLKKPGTATITCKTNDGSNLTKTCKVVVKKSHFSGEKKTINKIKYRVTSDTSGGGTVAVYGVSDKNAKSYTIQNSVTIDGYTYKVTEISSKAFANCKKATGIVLGTNIKSIGKEAFMNCKKLKTLTIKSKKLKTVGKNALKGIYSKATIKVPSSSLSKYKKLFKGKGQKTSVKIKKI